MAFVQWRIGALVEFLADLGLDKSIECQERRAPTSIWVASREGVAGFLSGMFGTDGSVSVNRQKKIEVSMASVSLGLLMDVQQLLFAFGIKGAIWNYPPRPEHHALYALSVFGIENVRRFARTIGFSCNRKQRKLVLALADIKGRQGRPVMNPRARVIARSLPPEPVYDLINVGPERQFVGSCMSQSNCWDRRRHSRAWVVLAFRRNKPIPLTKELWEQMIIKPIQQPVVVEPVQQSLVIEQAEG
jgi:hypothetical protein